MQGHVVIIDGASSSGKSSIIKELMPLLDDSYHAIAVDSFVDKVFLEQETLKLPEQEFFARVDAQTDIMYANIRTLVNEGKNVILDTVLSGLKGEKSIQEQIEKLKNIKIIMVLAHCPLPVLLERINKRNIKAKQEHNPKETRTLGTTLYQFGHIYQPKTPNDTQEKIKLETVMRKDVLHACELAKPEWNDNQERFEQFKNWLLSQLGVKDTQEATLTTRLTYDCIVDTGKRTAQKCAQHIAGHLKTIPPHI